MQQNRKIIPVILCGGSGSRLSLNNKNNTPKQFINFGNWTLIQRTLERVKNSIFDYPIISTNQKYLKQVRYYLKKSRVKKYKIVLEPAKKNTAPAILASALIKDIPNDQPIKPTKPSSQYGYFLTKKIHKKIHKVTRFIEKPSEHKAKKIIKKQGYWNSGMFLLRKDSVVYNFKKNQPKTFKSINDSINKSKLLNNTYYLNKNAFAQSVEKSFDYAILEKSKQIIAIKLDIPWSDLGNWNEISKIFKKNKAKYFKKKNVFYRPWGKYINLFEGKDFLVKELIINSKSSISLQKHNHRSENWLITQGKPKITINNNKYFKKVNESVFIPTGSVHRIENNFKKPVKIIEVQTGPILSENDIIRYKDIYGRAK